MSELKIRRKAIARVKNLLPVPVKLKWFTEFGHLNRGDMLTSEQHRCHNELSPVEYRTEYQKAG
ncbi:hypothetical protein ACYCDK_11870 [Escherichia coli]